MEIIYCIRNKINGKRYIGRTSNGFTSRYYKGRWWKYTCSESLRAAAKKYGHENFEVSILWRGEYKGACVEREVQLIREFGTLYPKGYNHMDTLLPNHVRRVAVLNNNSKWCYTILHMKTGELCYTDSLVILAKKIGYSVHSLYGKRLYQNVGKCWGDWKLMSVEPKHKPWTQKYILWNIVSRKWVYDSYYGLYRTLKDDGANAPKLKNLISGEAKRIGNWVLYRNRETWMERAPKRANKQYRLWSPSGEWVDIEHLPHFCRSKGLDYQSMMKMVYGTRKSYKGWRTQAPRGRLCRRYSQITIRRKGQQTATCRTGSEAQKILKCSVGTLYRLIDGLECVAWPDTEVLVEYEHAA